MTQVFFPGWNPLIRNLPLFWCNSELFWCNYGVILNVQFICIVLPVYIISEHVHTGEVQHKKAAMELLLGIRKEK